MQRWKHREQIFNMSIMRRDKDRTVVELDKNKKIKYALEITVVT